MKKYLLPILLLFPVLFTIPVYADEPQDLVIVLTPQTQTTSNVLCEDNSSVYPSCVGYNYVVVSLDTGTSTRTYSSNVKLYFNVGTDEIRMPASPSISDYSLTIPSGTNRVNVSKPDWLTDGTITVTLSASGNCPACPDCPSCPDCDEPLIVRIFKDGFWSVATAMVALIVPILALFLVFRLVHDFFWGRG